jgi:Cu/Ag efflux protein CusF
MDWTSPRRAEPASPKRRPPSPFPKEKTMKKLVSLVTLAAALALAGGTPTPASADDKVLGPVVKIDMAGKDANVAVATIKDATSGQTVPITVVDQVTLDKFKDHRISVGDEVKCKYEKKDGKNVATYFKKPGGC